MWRRSFEKEKKKKHACLSTISRSDCAHTTHGCTCTHRVIDVSKNRTSCEQQSLQKSTPTRITSSPHPSEQCLYVWTDFLHMSVARIQVCVCVCLCKAFFFHTRLFCCHELLSSHNQPQQNCARSLPLGPTLRACVCAFVHPFPVCAGFVFFRTTKCRVKHHTREGGGAGRQQKDGNFFK